MSSSSFYLGPLSSAPPSTASMLGTLQPVEVGAEVLVLHVPAGIACKDADVVRLTQKASHILVHVEAGAQADIALWIEGQSEHHTAEVIVGDEARCTVLTVNASTGVESNITQRGSTKSGAVLRWQNVTLGKAKTDHDLVSTVDGADGESAVDWMFYAKGTEQQTLNVRNVFNGRNGRGEILMRGIAEQKGYAQCRGMIEIGLQGGGTNTYLTQQVLMLDATSKVDAIPALEIKTNDVKASHSATVARVTAEDLFYFGARGIAPHEARRMFVLGFLGDITSRVVSQEQREAIVEAVEGKYEK